MTETFIQMFIYVEERKWREDGEDFMVRVFIICTFIQILLG